MRVASTFTVPGCLKNLGDRLALLGQRHVERGPAAVVAVGVVEHRVGVDDVQTALAGDLDVGLELASFLIEDPAPSAAFRARACPPISLEVHDAVLYRPAVSHQDERLLADLPHTRLSFVGRMVFFLMAPL